MTTPRQDPKLLYAINGVSAYHIANGKEESLTPAGPQTLSLLMVPTSSAFADPALGTENAEQDFYLHLHLPPELDLPLPATTQIYHQPPTSYLIPRWDLGPDSGAFTRIEFPSVESRKGIQEDVDTFETILAQCTAFLERAPPPAMSQRTNKSSGEKGGTITSPRSKGGVTEELPAYNPGDYRPGEAYAQGSRSNPTPGQIVLIDEDDGSVIGELSEGYQVHEDSMLKPGSKGRYLAFSSHVLSCPNCFWLTFNVQQTRLRLRSRLRPTEGSTLLPPRPNYSMPNFTLPIRSPFLFRMHPPPRGLSSPALTCLPSSCRTKPIATLEGHNQLLSP